jgi:pro-kumamolisin-like protein
MQLQLGFSDIWKEDLYDEPDRFSQVFCANYCVRRFSVLLFARNGIAQMVPLLRDAPSASATDLANANPAAPDMQMRMGISFKIRNHALFTAAANNDPTSPLYGKKLTPAKIHELFGAQQSDYRAIKRWLQNNGFIIVREIYGRGALDSIDFTVPLHKSSRPSA